MTPAAPGPTLRPVLAPAPSADAILRRAALASRAGALPPSLADCHFPGLLSLVLAEPRPGCLLRAYVAPPGGLHPWLAELPSPFLWHAHAYDFRSTTVVGRTRHLVLAPRGEPAGGRPAVALRPHALGGTGPGRWVRPVGPPESFAVARSESLGPGDAYSLRADEVHRVAFEPCPRTGWLVVLIEELRRAPRPEVAWSTDEVRELPGAAGLYRPMAPEEVEAAEAALRAAAI